jgi:hypothetical protein
LKDVRRTLTYDHETRITYFYDKGTKGYRVRVRVRVWVRVSVRVRVRVRVELQGEGVRGFKPRFTDVSKPSRVSIVSKHTVVLPCTPFFVCCPLE